MTHFYCDKNGIIKMVSDKSIETDTLIEYKITPTIIESENLLNKTNTKKIIDGKLVFKKTQSELEKESLINEVQSATSLAELKSLLIKIIK